MNIAEYYEYAKLSAAAYTIMDSYPAGFSGADFAAEANSDVNRSPVLPLPLALQTFDPTSTDGPAWTIPTNGYLGNDAAGFAATLFQRGKSVPQPH